MLKLEDRKLIFVGGKGGTGKSSCSAAIALHLSDQIEKIGGQDKILLFSTDPAHSLGDSFNSQIGDFPTPITNSLDAIEINADRLMEEFKREHEYAIESLLHLNKDEMELQDMTMPGIDEFMSLMKLSSLADQYKTVVIDTAPTGHTIRLLSMPSIVNTWTMFFARLHNKYKNIMWTLIGANAQDNVDNFISMLTNNVYNAHKLITDTEKTEFVIVTIPDLMAIEETKRLIISLYSSGIRINNLVINNVQTNLDCAFCRTRRSHQDRYIEEIEYLYPGLNKIYLPLFPEDINGMEQLKTLEDLLFNNQP